MSTIVHKYVVAARAGNQALQGVVRVDKRLDNKGIAHCEPAPSLLAMTIKGEVKVQLAVKSRRMLKFVLLI